MAHRIPRHLGVGALLIVAAVCSASAMDAPAQTKPAMETPETTSTTTYKNDEHRFRMSYPKSWESREGTAGIAAFFAGPLHADGTRPVVQVTVLPLPEKMMTLATLAEQMVGSLQQKVKDADVGKVEDARIAGGEAKRIVYTGTFHEDTYKFIQTVCVREKSIFVVTYANLEAHSESALDLVKAMLESFEFLGGKGEGK